MLHFKNFWCFFIILFSCICLFAQSNESVVLKTKTGKLYGTLLIPQNKSVKRPLVVFISGSGPTDRNGNQFMMENNSLKFLAEGLVQNDVASLRFDKRGVGESKSALKNKSKFTFDDYVKDVKAWVDLMKKDQRFSDIIIMGHSEGALIGTIASQSESISKLISLAGVGQPANVVLLEQLTNQNISLAKQAKPILDSLANGKTVKKYPSSLAPLVKEEIQPYLISWFNYNPQQEISKLQKPILIIQGTKDIQVKIEDANLLHQANPNSKLKIIEGMNHVLKRVDSDDRIVNMQTYMDGSLPLIEGLVEEVVEFITIN